MVEKLGTTPAQEDVSFVRTQEAVVCVATHDYLEELGSSGFDMDTADISDPMFAIEVQETIRHAFSYTHIAVDGKKISGREVTPEDLENISQTEFAERGLDLLLPLFNDSPRMAFGFAHPEVLEDAKQKEQVAFLQTLPVEDRELRLIFPNEPVPLVKKNDAGVLEIPEGVPDTDVLLAINSDADAFGRLYEKHVDQVYRHIYYRVGNPQDAEDLTAQVFLNGWKAVPRYKNMGRPFQVWLLSIANNLVIDRYRDRALKNQVSIEEKELIIKNDDTTDPVTSAERNFENEKFRKALSQLPNKDREAILMRFVDGLEFSEIGKILDIKENPARVRLHRAVAALKEIMRKDEDGTVSGIKKGKQKYTYAQLIASLGRRGDVGSGWQRETLRRVLDKHGITTRNGKKKGFYVTEEEFEEISRDIQEEIGLGR